MAAQACLGTRAQLVQVVKQDHQAIEVLKVKMEVQESLVNLELQDQLEMLVLLVSQDHQVAQVHLEHQVCQD